MLFTISFLEMLSENFCVSIIIRTRNIESRFVELLRRLSGQTLRPYELVVVDNFSSKVELEKMSALLLLVKRDFFSNLVEVKLVPIVDGEFSYPYSANVGSAVAEGDLVCVTNGHSLPCSDTWLENGIVHFNDPTVAGVGGYFTPYKSGTFWEKAAYNSWNWLNKLSKAYAKDTFFSTTNCVFRRSLWEKYPFDESLPHDIPSAGKFGGEDYDWSVEMLARGYNIVVEPKFNVYHCHNETPAQLIPKYLIWRRIRMRVNSFVRPRRSFTRLEKSEPLYYDI